MAGKCRTELPAALVAPSVDPRTYVGSGPDGVSNSGCLVGQTPSMTLTCIPFVGTRAGGPGQNGFFERE